MEKICTKCGEMKSLDEFGVCANGHLGRTARCRKCLAALARERYQADPVYRKKSLERASRYAASGKRIGYYIRYYRENKKQEIERSRKCRTTEKLAIRHAKYDAKFPEKTKARSELRAAVSRGDIKPMPCLVCGAQKADGHHSDYSKPLDVTWLCKPHHFAWHRIVAN